MEKSIKSFKICMTFIATYQKSYMFKKSDGTSRKGDKIGMGYNIDCKHTDSPQ